MKTWKEVKLIREMLELNSYDPKTLKDFYFDGEEINRLWVLLDDKTDIYKDMTFEFQYFINSINK